MLNFHNVECYHILGYNHTCTRAKDAIGEIFLPPPDEIFFHLHPPVEGPSWGWFCPPLLDNFEFSPKESPFYPPFWIKKSVSSPQIGEKIFSPPWRPKILPPPGDHLLVHVWVLSPWLKLKFLSQAITNYRENIGQEFLEEKSVARN